MKTNTKSTKPFKKLDCYLIKTKILRLPDKALKIWMCHLAHEGKGCQSYPSIETLMKVCGISKEDTVYKWRAWLATNHWLKKIGEIAPKRKGEYAVPIFSCTYEGTIPHQTGYGRQGHHTPSNGVRSHPIKRGTQPPRQTGVEVDLQQVTPIEVGKTTFLEPVVEFGSFGDSCGTGSQATDLPKHLAVGPIISKKTNDDKPKPLPVELWEDGEKLFQCRFCGHVGPAEERCCNKPSLQKVRRRDGKIILCHESAEYLARVREANNQEEVC